MAFAAELLDRFALPDVPERPRDIVNDEVHGLEKRPDRLSAASPSICSDHE